MKDTVAKYFHQLRNSDKHHLGLGDIRLTIAQQQEVVDMVDGRHTIAVSDVINRMNVVFNALIEFYPHADKEEITEYWDNLSSDLRLLLEINDAKVVEIKKRYE